WSSARTSASAAGCSSRPTSSSTSTAPTGSSTRRCPRPRSSAPRSAWPSTASGPSPRSSSPTTCSPGSTSSCRRWRRSATAPAAPSRPLSSCACRPAGGVRGGHHHSQNPDAHFVHTAGLKVVYPSTPADSAGLLRAAIRDDDPVVVMEPKRLYRAVKEEVPEGEHLVPIGASAVRRDGDDVVLVSYGGSMAETLKAADALQEQGIRPHVLDLRSLQPWDEDAVLAAAA